MIYTTLGQKINRVIAGDLTTGEVIVEVEANGQSEIKQTTLSILKADNGHAEIIEAVNTANMQQFNQCPRCGE